MTTDTRHTKHGHATCRITARKLAASLAVSIAIATAQTPCQAIAATSVSNAKAAFDAAAQKYDDACTASEQAQQAADTANASLEQAKGNAVTSIRSTYKSGGSDAVNAIMSALCSGNVSDGIRELAAWQSIAEWSDTNIQTLVSDKAAADQAKADADAAVSEAQTARDAAEQAYDAALKEQEEDTGEVSSDLCIGVIRRGERKQHRRQLRQRQWRLHDRPADEVAWRRLL